MSLVELSVVVGVLGPAMLGCHDNGNDSLANAGAAAPRAGNDAAVAGNNGAGGRDGGSDASSVQNPDDAALDGGEVQVDAGGNAGSDGSPAGTGGAGSGAGAGGSGAGAGGAGGAGPGTLFGDPVACEICDAASSCGESQLRDQCANAQGSAAAGPKAGAPKSQLCKELLSCMWRTGCAALGDFNDCICGGVPQCLQPGHPAPEGACRDEIYAGTESTVTADVNNRLRNTDYATGLAIAVTECDDVFCRFECGLCTAAPGSGPNGDSECHPSESGGGGS